MKVVGRSAFVFVVLCLSITIASGQVRQSRFAYVVTSSGNIAGYTINATTGALTPVPGSPFANGYANSITVDPTGRFAFVTQTNSSIYMQTTGGVSVYRIDPSTGSLSLAAGSPYLAATCCLSGSSASVDPTGKFLYMVEGVVNTYAELWGFAIDPVFGALSPISGSPFAVGYELSLPTIDPAGTFNLLGFAIDPMTGGLIPVPGSPHPGSSFNPITIGPKGKFDYTVDPIAGVSAFDIDSTTGSLTLAPGSPFSTPVGISVTLDPAERFAYALNNNCGYPPDGSVTGFTIDPSTGSLSEISTFPAGGCPQVLVMDPTGRFVYVVQQSGILGYTIDPSTGVLNPVSGSPFPGSYLSGLTIDSSGQFLYVANRAPWANLPDDPYVYGFSIDPTTGVLTAIPGSPFPTGSTPIAPVVLTAGPPPAGPPPTIISISPTSGTQGRTISNFTVNGSNFQAGAILSFSPSDITIDATPSPTISPTQIVASITIANSAAISPHDVIVMNPDGQRAVLSAAFSVLIAPPVTHTLTVASTTPNSGANVTAIPSDNNGQSSGTTQFALTYNDGAVITLTAAPTASGNNFSNWSGCDSTSGMSCTVTMSTERTVLANYTNPCNVSAIQVDRRFANGVVNVSATGSGCGYTVTITNLKSYWTNFVVRTAGSVTLQPVGQFDLYQTLGVLAPDKPVKVIVRFSAPGQSINILMDPSTANGVNASIANFLQGVLDFLSIFYPPIGDVQLVIEDLPQVYQAFAQMPHLTQAAIDLFSAGPRLFGAAVQLLAFTRSNEPSVLAGLLVHLGVDIGENVLVDSLKKPGGIANFLTTLVQNDRSALFEQTAGSINIQAQ